jgi:ribonuclease VapC
VTLDSSAVVAMLLREDGHQQLAEAVSRAETVAIGAPTLLETDMVMVGRFGDRGAVLVEEFLEEHGVLVLSFDGPHRVAATKAFARYGKGRHPAGLNYGDCMAYATAKIAEHPLLFTGNDFAQTDIPVALG